LIYLHIFILLSGNECICRSSQLFPNLSNRHKILMICWQTFKCICWGLFKVDDNFVFKVCLWPIQQWPQMFQIVLEASSWCCLMWVLHAEIRWFVSSLSWYILNKEFKATWWKKITWSVIVVCWPPTTKNL